MQTPKVLIVDDEIMHIDAIIDIFEDADVNFEVFTAFNGKSALEIALKEMPDLIISDWEMPEMSGIEFIKELKEDSRISDIPVIMCTGVMTTSLNLRTALNAGAVDFVRKPVDPIELIARTNSIMQLGASIKEIKANYAKMEQMARIDPLTQLSNRRDLMEKIMHQKSFADRNSRPFVLALADIDKFKNINDLHGHDCGDFVLVSISNLLKEIIRKQDIVGRWGGEEFLLCFPETDMKGGQLIAEKIRQSIADKRYVFNNVSFNLSITIGLSLYSSPGNVEHNIKQADIALYQGKENGRNRVVTYQA